MNPIHREQQNHKIVCVGTPSSSLAAFSFGTMAGSRPEWMPGGRTLRLRDEPEPEPTAVIRKGALRVFVATNGLIRPNRLRRNA